MYLEILLMENELNIIQVSNQEKQEIVTFFENAIYHTVASFQRSMSLAAFHDKAQVNILKNNGLVNFLEQLKIQQENKNSTYVKLAQVLTGYWNGFLLISAERELFNNLTEEMLYFFQMEEESTDVQELRDSATKEWINLFTGHFFSYLNPALDNYIIHPPINIDSFNDLYLHSLQNKIGINQKKIITCSCDFGFPVFLPNKLTMNLVLAI